jgi:hypothetical protein
MAYATLLLTISGSAVVFTGIFAALLPNQPTVDDWRPSPAATFVITIACFLNRA